mgnify:CR=1 FL=1|jgi:hypothetical protein
MEERTELCAYYRLKIKCDEINKCDGVSKRCFKYTTFEHIKQFYEKYGMGGIYDNDLLRRINEFEDTN